MFILSHKKQWSALFVLLLTCSIFPACIDAKDEIKKDEIQLIFKVKKGSGDQPMIAVWLETDTGDFVKTLFVFSKEKKYYGNLRSWKSKSKKEKKDMDAIVGATIKWGKERTVTIPKTINGKNILNGTYVIRIESRKDGGKHYRSFEIPLVKDYKGETHTDSGYVESVEIKLPAEAPPAETETETDTSVDKKA